MRFTSPSRLDELFLCLNGFSSVSEARTSCPSLRLLQITDNQLQDWAEVRKLGAMYPGLSTLVLANNHVKSVGDSQETLPCLFPNLRSINLNNSGLILMLCHVCFVHGSARGVGSVRSEVVVLCSSGLSGWEDVERLNFFPKLAEVKAKGIPLLQPYTDDERRSLLLAR